MDAVGQITEVKQYSIGHTLRACCAALVALFRRILYCCIDSSPLSLSTHQLKIGGVQNDGNTCTLSVLLQELAALPQFYNGALNSTLVFQMPESQEHFSNRIALRDLLKECVNKIQHGETVSKDKIRELSTLLIKLGWQNHMSCWRRCLHKIAPTIFSLPMSDPHDLYDFVRELLPDINRVLLSRLHDMSLNEQLEKVITNVFANTLLKIANDPALVQESPSEVMQVDQQHLQKIAHYIFSMPTLEPHAFYDCVSKLLPNTNGVLIGRLHEMSLNGQLKKDFTQVFASTLWRIADDPTLVQESPSETLQVGQYQFSLKLVHVFKNTWGTKHVIVYRKEGNQWFCCNDGKVTLVDTIPPSKIFNVVYESQIVSAA